MKPPMMTVKMAKRANRTANHTTGKARRAEVRPA